MSIVDDFIDSETAKMGRMDRFLLNYPVIETTRALAEPAAKGRFGEEKVIRPSLTERIKAVIIVVFLSLAWLVVLRLLLKGVVPWFVPFFGLVFLSFMIWFLLRNFFFNKKYNFTIWVTPIWIAVDETKFFWNEIAETCILSRHEGKSTNSYLIILKKDGTVEKFNLFLFGSSNRKLATIIEYYKAGLADDQPTKSI